MKTKVQRKRSSRKKLETATDLVPTARVEIESVPPEDTAATTDPQGTHEASARTEPASDASPSGIGAVTTLERRGARAASKMPDEELASSPSRLGGRIPAAADGAPARPIRSTWLSRLPRLTSTTALWSGPKADVWRGALSGLVRAGAEAVEAQLGINIRVEETKLSFGSAPIAGFNATAALGGGLGICEARLCPGLTAALLESLTNTSSPPIATAPDPVTAAVLGHGTLVICKALAESGLAHPRLTGSTSLRISEPLSIEVRLRVGEHLGHLQIRLDDLTARALARSLEEKHLASGDELHDEIARDDGSGDPSTDERSSSLRALPVRALLCMGPVRLSSHSLMSLRPGDVVVPDPKARLIDSSPAGAAHLTASGHPGKALFAMGRLDERRISITSLGHPTPTAQEPAMPSSRGPQRALPIDVHVVLDTIPMTLSELSRIGPGSVLTLSGPAPRAKLVAAEQTIAVGELVDVEGTLGVRVVEGADR